MHPAGARPRRTTRNSNQELIEMEPDGKLTIPSPERTVAFTDNPVTPIAENVSENDTTQPILSQLKPICTTTSAGDNYTADLPDKTTLKQMLGCFKKEMISMIQQVVHDNQHVAQHNQQNDHITGAQRPYPSMSHASRSPSPILQAQRSHPPMSHEPRLPTRISQALGPHPLMSHAVASHPPSHALRSHPSMLCAPGTQPSMAYILGSHPPISQTLESQLPMSPAPVSLPCMPIPHPTIHQSHASREPMRPSNQRRRVNNRIFGHQVYVDNSTDDEVTTFSQTDTDCVAPRRNQRQLIIHSKLPPYTGKETWEVWYNRFHEVALISHWSDQEKLVELLPRLQGATGEFVYGQLTHENRINYNTLITELNNRFRVVETCKKFASKFSNRHQGPNETVEEYAAELKRLYAKAHAHRNYDTRREDLLRRFLDGLNDEQTRFQVEYIKDPVDIDHDVNAVVHFRETMRGTSPRNSFGEQRHKKSVRAMHDPCQDDSSPDSDGDDMERISRVPTRNKNVIKHSAVDTVPTNKPTTDNSTTSSLLVSNDNSTMKEMVDLLREIKQGISMIQDGRSKSYTSRRFDKPSTGSSRQGQNTGPHSNNKQSSDYACFRCGDKTHFIRNCPFPMVTGQMNLAMETPIMFNEQENKASPRYTRQQNSATDNMNLN